MKKDCSNIGCGKKLDFLKFAVTYRCNLSCKFCQQQKEKKIDLSWKNFKKILNDRNLISALRLVIFTGGEPLIWPHLNKAIKLCKEKGNGEIGIFSNGTLLTEDKIKKFRILGVDWFRISIYGATSPINDSFLTNVKSFDKIVKALKNLKKYGYNRKVRVTIMKPNLKDISGIIEMLRCLGIEELDFRPYNPTLSPRANKEFELSSQDMAYVIPLILKYRNIYKDSMQIKFLPGCYDFLFEERMPKVDAVAKCNCGKSYLGVTAEGHIRVCFGVHDNLGNIAKDNINNVWQTSNLLSQVKNFKGADECQGCIFIDHCKDSDCFAVSLNLYGDINHKNKLCPLDGPLKTVQEWRSWKKEKLNT